jgi:hypothetical protein
MKTCDFLDIKNDSIEKISRHENFDPSKLDYLIPFIIDSGRLTKKNAKLLSDFTGEEIPCDYFKIIRNHLSKIEDYDTTLKSTKLSVLLNNFDHLVDDKNIIRLFAVLCKTVPLNKIINCINFIISNPRGIIIFNSTCELYPKIKDVKIDGIDILSLDEYLDQENINENVFDEYVIDKIKSIKKNKLTIVSTALFEPLRNGFDEYYPLDNILNIDSYIFTENWD